MLIGIGRLVPEGGEVAVPLAVERAVCPVLLRLAADDQDGLPLDVLESVVVVVELLRRVLRRDPVAGEDDRDAVERPPRADRQRVEVALLGRDRRVTRPAERERGGVHEPGIAADRERLKIPLGSLGRLEARVLERGRDVVGRGLDPLRPGGPAVAGVVGQERHVGPEPVFRRRHDPLLGRRPRGRRCRGDDGQAARDRPPPQDTARTIAHARSPSLPGPNHALPWLRTAPKVSRSILGSLRLRGRQPPSAWRSSNRFLGYRQRGSDENRGASVKRNLDLGQSKPAA